MELAVAKRNNLSGVSYKRILETSEEAFAIASLILYSAGVIALILTKGASEGDGTIPQDFDFSLNRLLFLFNYLVTFALLALRWRRTLYVVTSNLLIWALVLLVPASAIWSVEPAKSLNASIALIGTCLFGLYLASNYSPRKQLQLLGWSFAISILLSFVFAIALPKYGIMAGVHTGAWRGIYTHKNWLGRMMVLASGLFIILANDAKKNRPVFWFILSLAFLLILLCRSSSSILNTILISSIVLAGRTLRLQTKLLIPVLLCAVAFGVIFALGATAIAEMVLGSFGKDLSLTGRTDIWPYVIDKIRERPFLGYGYAVFWNGLEGESADIWRALRWTVPDSHNGFLDLWVDLGFLGFIVFLFGFIQTLARSLLWVRLSRSWVSLWSLMLLVYLVLSNITESALLGRNSLILVLYTALMLTASLELRRYQKTQSIS